jgi:glycosyltransferase involved in cell wall biosynthesis
MKIGIFIDSVEAKGGQVRVVANLCKGWVESGWEVHLITTALETCSFAIPASVVRHSLLTHPRRTGLWRIWDNILITLRLGRLSRQISLDGVVAISAVESVQLALARCPPSMTRLGSEHGYARHYPMPWLLGICRRFLYPKLDGVVCPAYQTAMALREDCPGTNAINIPNLLIWPSPQGAGTKILPLDARRKRFVTCGRLVHDKGFEIILEAFSLVALDCPGWDLVIIGDGPSESPLKALARAKGLEERVIFVGFSDQANLYYDVCDIFVYGSPKEGFGMVIAEAQASGLPAICFDCLAGPSDIVSDQKSGLLISLGDLDGFARAMLQLASDETLRAHMAGQAGHVAERFGIDSIIPRWRSAILKSTKNSGDSPR